MRHFITITIILFAIYVIWSAVLVLKILHKRFQKTIERSPTWRAIAKFFGKILVQFECILSIILVLAIVAGFLLVVGLVGYSIGQFIYYVYMLIYNTI